MKKIMFNDKYGLTQAVLSGRKTQTRRIAYNGDIKKPYIEWVRLASYKSFQMLSKGRRMAAISTYGKGEIVAVAQSYRDAGVEFIELYAGVLQGIPAPKGKEKWGFTKNMSGYTNKMFVRADLMPHRICITDIKMERLQDISDEDCMKEGIRTTSIEKRHKSDPDVLMYYVPNLKNRVKDFFETPQKAYASLIDRISGKGTWERNPYVFVYDFELID